MDEKSPSTVWLSAKAHDRLSFLDLARELRDQIYEVVIHDSRPIEIVKTDGFEDPLLPNRDPERLVFSTMNTYIPADLVLGRRSQLKEYESGNSDRTRAIRDCLDKMLPSYTKHIRVLRIEFIHYTDDHHEMHDVLDPDAWLEIRRPLPNLKKLVLQCSPDGDVPITSAWDYLDQPDDPQCEQALRKDLTKWLQWQLPELKRIEYDWVCLELRIDAERSDEEHAVLNKVVAKVWEEHRHAVM